MKKSKSRSLEKVTAAGGIIIQQGENNGGPGKVLLIYRRGVWDLPKGKLEQGETIKECAAREVKEEVGLSALPEIKYSLLETYHEYKQQGATFGKTTHWYTMELSTPTNNFIPEHEEGIERVEWHSLAEAKKKVGYTNLGDVLTALESTW